MLEQKALPLISVERAQPNLEEVFVKLTQSQKEDNS